VLQGACVAYSAAVGYLARVSPVVYGAGTAGAAPVAGGQPGTARQAGGEAGGGPAVTGTPGRVLIAGGVAR